MTIGIKFSQGSKMVETVTKILEGNEIDGKELMEVFDDVFQDIDDVKSRIDNAAIMLSTVSGHPVESFRSDLEAIRDGLVEGLAYKGEKLSMELVAFVPGQTENDGGCVFYK